MPIGDTGYVRSFEIYHINEEISHSKCHFSHPGSFTRIPYFYIIENQRKLNQKSANTFWPVREQLAKLAICEQMLNMLI